MILNGSNIDKIQVSNTYDNVVHLSIAVTALYSNPASVYKIYDGNGYEIPFNFRYNTEVKLTGFNIDSKQTVFGFVNCEYESISEDISNATITNILTANQYINKGLGNSVITDFRIAKTGIVNHTLDTSVSAEHPSAIYNPSEPPPLTTVTDAVANYEYLKVKSEQLSGECVDYAKSFDSPKDALLVAYNNDGNTVSFSVSKSQMPISGKLSVVIIGTLVSWAGESAYSAELKVNGETVHTVYFNTYASTGKGGKAACCVNASFLHVKSVEPNKIYNVVMECKNIKSSSIVVLCGEEIE